MVIFHCYVKLPEGRSINFGPESEGQSSEAIDASCSKWGHCRWTPRDTSGGDRLEGPENHGPFVHQLEIPWCLMILIHLPFSSIFRTTKSQQIHDWEVTTSRKFQHPSSSRCHSPGRWAACRSPIDEWPWQARNHQWRHVRLRGYPIPSISIPWLNFPAFSRISSWTWHNLGINPQFISIYPPARLCCPVTTSSPMTERRRKLDDEGTLFSCGAASLGHCPNSGIPRNSHELPTAIAINYHKLS